MLVKPARPAFGPSATSSPPAKPQISAAIVMTGALSPSTLPANAEIPAAIAVSSMRCMRSRYGPGLVEKHRVQRADRDAEADAGVVGRDADAERYDDRGRVAQRDAEWHVARFEFDQVTQHAGFPSP